jgi:SM-20-related protein
LDSERASADHDRVAAALAGPGWSVVPGFLDGARVRALAEEATARRARGDFAPARVGRGAEHAHRAGVRGDERCWLDAASASPAEAELLARLESLRVALNRSLFLGLFELEAQMSAYPTGARYERHLDAFRDGGHRVVSTVVYLNERWGPEDGGALRLYVEGERAVEVPPLGGTLVAFLSDRFEHEVLPATRERLSVAAWLRRRAP